MLAQRSRRRVAPEMRAARAKVIVRGFKSWSGAVKPIILMNGWAAGSWNMRFGSVRTARNGSMEPMLRISANDAAIIRIRSSANWDRRRLDMWYKRRVKRVGIDWDMKDSSEC